jgi:hypothetical protein
MAAGAGRRARIPGAECFDGVQRGEEYVEARPMNWGTNLTLIGAIHL